MKLFSILFVSGALALFSSATGDQSIKEDSERNQIRNLQLLASRGVINFVLERGSESVDGEFFTLIYAGVPSYDIEWVIAIYEFPEALTIDGFFPHDEKPYRAHYLEANAKAKMEFDRDNLKQSVNRFVEAQQHAENQIDGHASKIYFHFFDASAELHASIHLNEDESPIGRLAEMLSVPMLETIFEGEVELEKGQGRE